MNNSDRLQRFIRNRRVRLGFAAALIVASAWAFLPYVSYRIASSAFVNAELVRVAAPAAGRLTRDLPRKGGLIDASTVLTLLEPSSLDQRRLHNLGRQAAVSKARAELASTQLAAIASVDVGLGKRTQIYRAAMISRLQYELDEAKAETAGCLIEVRHRRDVGSRMEKLVKSGTASEMRTDEALASMEAASTRCAMADARRQRLASELASAEDGVYLRDGANDAPYSQQQRDRLFLRQQELETKILEEGLASTQLDTEMAEERARLDRHSHFDLPANHVVWSVAASPGSTVSEGQTLFDLASCEQRFITVELPEREFQNFKVGSQAFVRLIGGDEWKPGQVRQVRGSAARADDRLLAAQIQTPSPNSITVEIGWPQDGEMDRNSFCNVGRLAEVRFQRPGLTLLGDWGWRLKELVGNLKMGPTPGRVAGN